MPRTWDAVPLRSKAALFLLGACAISSSLPMAAQSGGQKCPVRLEHIEVSYSHVGGKSLPQLSVSFANRAGRDIARATFRLSLLNAAGGSEAYPTDFEYEQGLAAGKRKLFAWDLDSGAVDIHRTGETVVLEKVGYADGSQWTDDGSESCALTVDFRAR